MALELLPEMFAGNFIKELPRKRVPMKGRSNGTLQRCVLLRCLHCNVEFERALAPAKRTKQQCCSKSCFQKRVATFDGGNEKHPLYSRWLSMTQRVNNPNHSSYIYYGGRGITIEDGLDDFTAYADYTTTLSGYVLKNLDSLQLDRRNNNGNYTKGNLRWATRSTQTANQRPNTKGFNTYTGVTWSTAHLCWVARVVYEGKNYCSSTHATELDALAARNACIQQHALPHPIQSSHL